MVERLRDDRDALGALITRTSTRLGIRDAYVEKDFWVTEVLRAASSSRLVKLPDGRQEETSFIFKGGTSLSRVYGLIERFSEDVDLLAVFPDGATATERHKVLKQVDKDVSQHLKIAGRVPNGASTTGVKRYTTYRYSTDLPDSSLKDGVLLELGSRGGTHPTEVHSFRSMLAGFAVEELGEDPGAWQELASFNVNVLSPERTLLEKVSALHDAASRQDAAALSLDPPMSLVG